MIKAKTIPERVQDISNRCGLSVDVVQRVLEARADSILDDLRNGMRVVDYGVCSLKPCIGKRIGVNGMVNYISVRCEASPKIVDALNEVPNYQLDETDDDNGSIRVKTLSAFM